jgi:hypothetical protein
VGDIVAGNSLILLTKLGIDLSKYSNLKDYYCVLETIARRQKGKTW